LRIVQRWIALVAREHGRENKTMLGPRISLRSVSIVSICSFLLLGLQLAFQMFLAAAFGAGAAMDAYVAAIALPAVISSVLAGAVSYVFVPRFIDAWTNDAPEAAWALAGSCLAIGFLVTASLALACTLAAEPIVAFLQPGFLPDRTVTAVALLRLLGWLAVINTCVSLLQAIHHCRGQFATPALGALAGMAVTIIFAAVFYRRIGVEAVAVGTLSGALINAVILGPILARPAPWTWVGREALWRILRPMLPLVVIGGYCQVDPLVDRYLASSMRLGSIAHLGYAGRINAAALLVATSGLSYVAFPVLAGHSASGNREGLRELLAQAIRLLMLVLLPLVAAITLYTQDVLAELFERGRFSSSDTQAVAWLVVLYLGVLVGGGFGEILAKTFYALSDVRTPLAIGACGLTLGVALKIWLSPDYRTSGLAVATSVYYLLNATALGAILHWRLGGLASRALLATAGRAAASTIAATTVAWSVTRTGIHFDAIAAVVVGAAVYLAALWLLREPILVSRDRSLAAVPAGRLPRMNAARVDGHES